MANFQVKDGYGSIITIQSSTFGVEQRQIVGASIIGNISANIIGSPSISGQINVGSIVGFPGFVSTVNSTSVTLGANGVFTGTSEEVKDFGSITVSIFSDQASAGDGLSLQQSSNGTNWDITDTYTIAASTGKTFSVQPAARFFRVVYTNGSTIQGSFRLQTVYHPITTKSSSQRASDGYSNETDLEQVQSFGMVYNGINWDRLRGNSSIGVLVNTGAGSVITRQSGTVITSLVSTVPSSVIVGASIFGLVPISGQTSIITTIAPTATVTSVKTAASVTTLIALNANRRGVAISNNSATSVLVKLGGMNTVNDFTILLQNTDYYEVPFNYSGAVSHYASSVAGLIYVTEIT